MKMSTICSPSVVAACVAVCCSVLQCVTVRCSVLPVLKTTPPEAPIFEDDYTMFTKCCCSVCCSVLQIVAKCCSVLPCVAECCSVLQRVAVFCSVLECVAYSLQTTTPCSRNVLQCDAVCCSLLQSVAVSTACCTNLHVWTISQLICTIHTVHKFYITSVAIAHTYVPCPPSPSFAPTHQ